MPKKQPLKPIPKCETEAQEQEFWSTYDSTAYVDWSQAQRITFERLKPSTQTISFRLPEALLEDLKLLANKRDVPYQSLLKCLMLSIGSGGASQQRRVILLLSVGWVPPDLGPSGACLHRGTRMPAGLVTPPRVTPHRGGASSDRCGKPAQVD